MIDHLVREDIWYRFFLDYLLDLLSRVHLRLSKNSTITFGRFHGISYWLYQLRGSARKAVDSNQAALVDSLHFLGKDSLLLLLLWQRDCTDSIQMLKVAVWRIILLARKEWHPGRSNDYWIAIAEGRLSFEGLSWWPSCCWLPCQSVVVCWQVSIVALLRLSRLVLLQEWILFVISGSFDSIWD